VLFECRRSLLSDLSVVLFDTTSLMFYGAGGETLGRHGKSKNHRPDLRPDLRQVIVGAVLDAQGRPIGSETWPGNATDVKALLPVVRRLRERFGIRCMCLVADREMISAETIAELEALGVDYILGARECGDKEVPRDNQGERTSSRSSRNKEVREIVLTDSKPMVPRGPPSSTVCARRCSRATSSWSAPGLSSLPCHASRGALRDRCQTSSRRRPLRLDPRFDGIYVLRTNSKLPLLSVALAYRQLWKVEAIVRSAKAIPETRPTYHHSDNTIVGHLFCSFLALILRKEAVAGSRC